MWWEAVIAVVGGLLVVWLVSVAALYVVARRQGDPGSLREALRLLPDVLRLLRRLGADPTLPRGVRWWIGLTVAYLAMPLDLVPDFLPVVGYADDVLVVALAPAGLDAVRRLL